MQSKTTQVKSGFGSKLGFILAAAGSAVGLGNIWRFPYLAAKYGGGMFLLVYLIFAVTFGFALMATEIAIGRRTGKSVIQAYSDMNCHFKPLGWLAGAIPVIILPYYCVIGGWVLKYLVIFTTGSGASAAGDGSYFSNFIGHAGSPMLFFAIFILLTAVVVMLGVQKGVEKVSKLMMPVLLILIVGISIYTLTLPGAIDGLIYYVKPDFNQFSIKTVIAAVGQLFYSMSLAMGIMITYGSYVKKDVNLNKAVSHIEIMDTAVAFLAGMMIIPAVFVFSGIDGMSAGPGLMFVSLPSVFYRMGFAGRIVGLIFFVLAGFAALTSCISVLESIVANCMEIFHADRKKTTGILSVIYLIATAVIALGYSIFYVEVKLPNGSTGQLLDIMDYISNSFLMPFISLLSAILIGWIMKPSWIAEEMELNGEKFSRKKLYNVMIKYIMPLIMIILFLQSTGLLNMITK